MKKLYSLILLSIINIIISFQLAHGQSATINLNTAGTGNQLHEATQSITLSAGFSYDAQSANTFTARVVAANGQAYNFTEPTTSTTPTITTTGVVGTIEGSWSVSPTGGAIYSIPIKVPPGINGMVPNLSIVYNSQANEGLLGRGWNVSGLSSITRVGSDYYHDGQITSVQYANTTTSTCNFALDGQRLIAVSSSSGSIVYRTEIETFSQITSYGGTTDNPQYFIVQTKDGKTLYYGNSTDSRIIAQGRSQALTWNVNQITDVNGNYITANYTTNNGAYYPNKIIYTGNASVTPFDTIAFSYTTRNIPIVSWISGSNVTMSSSISKISIKNEGTPVSQFSFTYNSDDKLTQITEYGKNNTQINSSAVNWGQALPLFTESGSSIDPQVTGRYDGDFNGDGLIDYVIVKNSIWYLYLIDGYGNFNLTTSGNMPANSTSVNQGDFNGDGKEDLLAVCCNGNCNPVLMISTGSGFTTVTPTSEYWTTTSTFLIADFMGDGKDDVFLQDTDGHYDLYEYNFTGTTYNSTSDIDGGYITSWLPSGSTYHTFSKINAVPLNMTGNGKADLMILYSATNPSDGGFYVYELDDHPQDGGHNLYFTKVADGTTRTPDANATNMLFGDFNGDGKTDIVYYENGQWSESTSTGTAFGGGCSPSALLNLSSTVNNLYAFDVDGDGRCDIVNIGRGTNASSSVSINVYHNNGGFNNSNPSLGNGFDKVKTYTHSIPLGFQQNYNHFGDYNGDGTIDFYYDDGSNGRMYSFNQGITQNFVESIQNGFGLYSHVSYQTLTDNNIVYNNSIYTKGTNSQYPVMDFQGPLYVVSSVSTDDIPGTSDVTNYTYNSAKFHLQGKGFLGFSKITSSNAVHNIQTIDQYGYNPTYFNVYLNQRNVNTAGGTAISQVVNTNSLIRNTATALSGNVNPFYPYVSKSVSNESLRRITKTTTDSIDNKGNPVFIKDVYDDGSYNTTAYSNYSSAGSWTPYQPQNVTITKKHYLDANTFSLSSAYTYQPVTGLLLKDSTGLLTTTYQYNTNGTPSQVTVSDGTTRRTNHFGYDPKGRLVTDKYNALNHHTQYSYDYATGNVLTQTAPNGKVTSYTYDDFGRQTSISDPTTQPVTISYQWATSTRPTNAVYYKLTTCTGLPSVKEYYDWFGRVLRTEKTGFDGTSIYSSTAYNAAGQITQSSLPFYSGQQALARNYTYDTYNRLMFDAGPSGTVAYTYTGKTTQTATGAGQNSSKTIDSQGNVVTSTDAGGSISYTYKSIGKPANITTNGATVSMTYDAYGRQKTLKDPDAGTTTYGYNGYNEITSQRDTLGHTYTMKYGILGRDSTRTGPEGTTTYTYDPTNNPGLLSYVTYSTGIDSFKYDVYGRITGKYKTLTDGSTKYRYGYGYTYDKLGRDSMITYPSGFSITNNYNTNGYLSAVKRTSNNAIIWQGQTVNALGQITQSYSGDNLTTTKTYSNIGLLSSIQTGSVQNLVYNFDPGTGNLLSRTDGLRSLTETFTYDNLNRLTGVSGPSPLSMVYSTAGNITSKTAIGTYTYGGSQPHAVNQVSNPQNLIPSVTQNISYTPFNKVNSIGEGVDSLQYTYDGDRQRTISKFYVSKALQKTTHYSDGYEKEIIGSNTRELSYISGGDGLAAIDVLNNGVDTMYYVHTDALGSYDVITNQSGAVVQYYSFDAWGRRHNPTNWTYNNMPTHSLFSRGYTGHEHLDAFNLINMNGRVYDPLLARMLSPDNEVQQPGNTQNYNRYSYCLNNPFAYTDPSGYTWLSRIGDAIEQASVWLGNFDDRISSWMSSHHISASVQVGGSFSLDSPAPSMSGSAPGTTGTYSSAAIMGNQYNLQFPTSTLSLPLSHVNFDPGTPTLGSDGLYSFGGSSVTPANGAEVATGSYGSGETVYGAGIDPASIPVTFGYPNDPPGLESSFVDAIVFAPIGLARGLISASSSIAGTTIIGEGMARVEAMAARTSGSVILNDMPSFSGTANQVTSQMMQYNRQWMLNQMRSGRTILDIGLDVNRSQPSIFYQMEQNMIKNYQILHPGSLNIIKP